MVLRGLCALAVWLWGCSWAWGAEFLWFSQGRPTAQALEALHILASADEEGLDPGDYEVEALRRGLETILWGEASSADLAHWDERLTRAMTRYLRHLHWGRVDPQRVGARFSPQRSSFAPHEDLPAALAQGRLDRLVAEAAPKIPLYAALRSALAHARALAARPEVLALWERPLPPFSGDKVEPGQSYAGLPAVIRRLKALGDLPETAPETSVLTPTIAKGIRVFQERHGLLADGVLGKRTLARIEVSPAQGVRQITLAMERLRWTQLRGGRVIAVYLPENVLEAYEVQGDGTTAVRARMRVITGNAGQTPTPIFDDEIRAIELSPYWNVPYSIAKDELVPKFLKNPEAFFREGFEFVLADGSVSGELSFERLDDAARGRIRLRQRPGPMNPMGDIKFVLTNKDGIFLHHTANPQLFQRARRDLSHGCIRVEDPVGLAQFVLDDDPAWDAQRLQHAMGQDRPTVLRVRRPPRVVLVYSTVRVQDGRPAFLADLYGLDRLLDEALRHVPSTP